LNTWYGFIQCTSHTKETPQSLQGAQDPSPR
jgi:hypothetical protein